MSPRRKSVVMRRRVGNIENSSGSFTYMDIISITSESPIWKMNKKSRIAVGSGMISKKTISTTNAVTILFVNFEKFFKSVQILFILAVNMSQNLSYRIVEFLWNLHTNFYCRIKSSGKRNVFNYSYFIFFSYFYNF